ncbi:HAD-like domain-containing protein [Pelagophyceae sp. CCMP2097]|nr:HAD-like domain-containing protein [Pelagophyceae sp. CCMP2097]
MKPAFKAAYKAACSERPCFGGPDQDERDWWRYTVKLALEYCGCHPSDKDFDRYFRRVYQFYGSAEGYGVLDDAGRLVDALAKRPEILLGITSNTARRTTDNVLPMLGLSEQFSFFACAQDCGAEKPDKRIFEAALESARFWLPDLEPHQVLHIGDSLEADLCGARAFGFEALLLDRSDNPRVTKYQDWLQGPEYDGKCDVDIESSTIKSLDDILGLVPHFARPGAE